MLLAMRGWRPFLSPDRTQNVHLSGQPLETQVSNLPIIQGGSPELASVAEGVWRHAADHEGLAALAQLKEGLVGPHICALPAHVDGNVTHNLHALSICIRLQQRHWSQHKVAAAEL